MNTDIFAELGRFGVVPVIAIESVDAAIPLADALLEGGLPVAEITFRTEAAAEVIQRMAEERPQLLIGAGTVLTRENALAAKRCGARFALAPGLNAETVAHAREIGLPFIPGVATASDIERGLSLGCAVLKFFPSEQLGGVAMINALSAPYQHRGIRFVPTGGVTEQNARDYLATRAVVAVGGTWIARKEDIAAGRWEEIRHRARRAAELAASIERG